MTPMAGLLCLTLGSCIAAPIAEPVIEDNGMADNALHAEPIWPEVLDMMVSTSLNAVLTDALTNNSRVAVAEAQVDSVAADLAAVRAQRFPEVGLSASSRSNQPEGVLSLTQPIWTFGRINSEITIAERRVDGAATNTLLAQQTLGLEVVDLWAEMMRSTVRISVHSEEVAQLREFDAMMRRRVESSVSSDNELALVETRLLTAESALAQARQARRMSRESLEVLSQTDRWADYDGWEAVSFFSRVRQEDIEAVASYADAVAPRLPAVIASANEVAIAQAEVEAARSRRGVEIMGQFEQRIPLAGGNVEAGQASIGLTYTPGAVRSTGHAIRSAQSNLEAAELSLASTRREAVTQVRTALSVFDMERSRQAALARNADNTLEILESYQRQFQAGQKTWVEVLNAVRELTQARLEHRLSQVEAVAQWSRIRILLLHTRMRMDD